MDQEVTAAFWIIKIMAMTVGKTGADYLAVHVGLGTAIAGGIMAALLLAVLVVRLRARPGRGIGLLADHRSGQRRRHPRAIQFCHSGLGVSGGRVT